MGALLHPRALVIPRQDAWADTLVTFCAEVLARVASQERALQAERLAAENQHFATWGAFRGDASQLQQRHDLALGNAELLLMEPGAFSARVREQLNTIRAMAMRMNQMMLRLASLETEMEIVESDPADMPQRKVGTSARPTQTGTLWYAAL